MGFFNYIGHNGDNYILILGIDSGIDDLNISGFAGSYE